MKQVHMRTQMLKSGVEEVYMISMEGSDKSLNFYTLLTFRISLQLLRPKLENPDARRETSV